MGSHYFHTLCPLFCFPGLDVSVVARFCLCDGRTDERTPCVKIVTTYSAVAWWINISWAKLIPNLPSGPVVFKTYIHIKVYLHLPQLLYKVIKARLVFNCISCILVELAEWIINDFFLFTDKYFTAILVQNSDGNITGFAPIGNNSVDVKIHPLVSSNPDQNWNNNNLIPAQSPRGPPPPRANGLGNRTPGPGGDEPNLRAPLRRPGTTYQSPTSK